MALNAKQVRFVEAYQRTLLAGKPNATQAYIEAGYKAKGHSAESAAARLLSHVEVQQLLRGPKRAAEVARVEAVRGIEVTRDRIRLEMARLAFVNPKSLFHADGTPKGIHELDDDTACALAQFEVEEEVCDDGTTVRTRKYKLWDKRLALRDLADTEAGVWAEDAKGDGAGAGATNVNVTVVNRIDQFAAAFAGAADREEAGAVPGDGAGKPLAAGADQGGAVQ
jgi:phage terminase small subunit